MMEAHFRCHGLVAAQRVTLKETRRTWRDKGQWKSATRSRYKIT